MGFGDMESAGIESAGGGSDMDFDLMNEADWAAFAIVLETALDGLEEGRFLCVEVEVPRKSGERLKGSVPYIQAVREPEGLHVEVASNESLDPRFRLSKESRRLLRDLGLSKPEGDYLPNYWAQFRMHRVEEAARLLVTALRAGYGVENPAFLQTDHKALVAIIGTAGGPVRESLPAEEEPMRPWLPVPGEDLAVYPRNFDDLSRLIAEALLPMVGPLPKPDEDGDAGILAGPSSVIFVRPSGSLPEVVVHSPVVVNVTDRKAARREVAMLNDVHPGHSIHAGPQHDPGPRRDPRHALRADEPARRGRSVAHHHSGDRLCPRRTGRRARLPARRRGADDPPARESARMARGPGIRRPDRQAGGAVALASGMRVLPGGPGRVGDVTQRQPGTPSQQARGQVR